MNFRGDVRRIKALADENRLAIMIALQHGEKCGCVLLEELNITQPTLSHHMKILCDSGIVTGRKEGKWMYYSVSGEGAENAVSILKALTTVDKQDRSCCCQE